MKAGHLYQLTTKGLFFGSFTFNSKNWPIWDIDGNKFGARTIGNIKHLDLLMFLKSVGVANWGFECFLVITHLGICMITCRHLRGPAFEEVA